MKILLEKQGDTQRISLPTKTGSDLDLSVPSEEDKLLPFDE
jgi:hypothetical protein